MRRPRLALWLLSIGLAVAGCSLPVALTVPAPLAARPAPAAPAAKDPPIAVPKRPPSTPTPVPLVLPTPAVPFATKSLPPVRLIIPSIGLDSRVVPISTRIDNRGSLAWETAAFAVGHHAGSANPGQVGNVVLSGHISSPHEGDVFRNLPRVQLGDGVIVVTAEQQFLYRVYDIQVVPPQAVEVLDPTDTSIVTLITCVPDGVYSHRLVVRAVRV
ncbi:MAG TPA: sortase [Chloroflexota bacterium]|jgi:sortase A|nr:sortase [Chloroflexota bacterium]